MMRYTVQEGYLPVADFQRLFAAAGWGEPSEEQVSLAIRNSWAIFAATDEDGQVIAMARLIGDGAMAFFLKDVVVDPDYQGQGVGKALIAYIESYIRAHLKKGWKARYELMAAKGKEGFYLKCGFTENPNEASGAGLTKIIE